MHSSNCWAVKVLAMMLALGSVSLPSCSKKRTRVVRKEVACISIVPPSGPLAGGTPVTILGAGFQPGAVVLFEDSAGTAVTVSGDGKDITCLTPPGALGPVDVAVWNPDEVGCRLVDGFSYVPDPLTIQPASLPNATIGQPYSQLLSASGGLSPYSFTVESGTLPDGLSLVGDAITGTPQPTAINSTFTARATDADAPPMTGLRPYTLLVNVEITTATLPDGEVGKPYSAPLTAIGGDGVTYDWSVATGVLPCGLSVQANPGGIAGTPCCDGSFPFEVRVASDPPALTAAGSLSLRITEWTSVGEEVEGAQFGTAVASAGDVNGDGYADVIIGAQEFGSGSPSMRTGKVYLFYGGPQGLSMTHDWSSTGEDAPGSNYGHSVASAGDVDGDGYDDILVDAQAWDEGGIGAAGKVYLFRGGPAGLEATASWTSVGEPQQGASFGSALAAGDVDGDGYSDIVPGAWSMDGQNGKVFVFRGGPAGPSAVADWTSTGEDRVSAGFGVAVATADVNADGIADLIVGAHDGSGSPMPRTGKAFLYLGSLGGLALTPSWTSTGDFQDMSRFGSELAGAGDVNGDGYEDVIVSAPPFDTINNGAGKAYVFHGNASGLDPSPAWTSIGNDEINAAFGYSVAGVMDANGDGFSDVVVGAWMLGTGGGAGKAFLYLGSPSGLAVAPVWTSRGDAQADANYGFAAASAGDVNGDGMDEIVLGAWHLDTALADVGQAYVYCAAR